MELGRALATGARVRDPQDVGDGIDDLHTGDDPIVDACTGVISALEEIIEDLGPPRDSDVSNALELAHGALKEMQVIDAWAVAKAREAPAPAVKSRCQHGTPGKTPRYTEPRRLCACVSEDAERCIALRYPEAPDMRDDGEPERCECSCHDFQGFDE